MRRRCKGEPCWIVLWYKAHKAGHKMACKFGINSSDCRAANDILVQIGSSRLNCNSCDLNGASLHAVSRYQETTNDKEKRRVVRWFKKMGVSTTGFETGALFNTGFCCPILKEEIVTPCDLAKCSYHLDYPWGANCLLAYTHQQDIEALSPEEIAYLYHFPIDQVKKLLSNAITALRSNAIDQQVVNELSIDSQFSYFITDRVCCVCESTLEEEVPKSLQIEAIGAVYCSKECKNQMHPLLIKLEVTKGIPITKILDWTFRRYKTLTLAEQALGIPRWLAIESCKRFLDKSIESYYPAIQMKKPRETRLVRRTWQAPAFVDNMIANMQPISRAITNEFGPRNVMLTGLRRQLNHLIQHL